LEALGVLGNGDEFENAILIPNPVFADALELDGVEEVMIEP